MKSINMMKYLFLTLGAVFLAVATFSARNTQTFIAESTAAPGTVIDMVRRQSSDSDTYAPVVQFATTAGDTIEFTSSTSSNPPSYHTGERVEVLYRPNAPHAARINAFGSLWGTALIVGGLGAIFFSIGAGIVLAAVFEARKAADLKLNTSSRATTSGSILRRT